MSKTILGISGSPRKNGNTDDVVEFTLKRINAATGIETEFLHLGDFDIKPCYGCRICMDFNDCAIDSDEFHNVFYKFINAHAVVLASPVYWFSPPGILKNFIDRTHGIYACPEELPPGKNIAMVSIAADSGFETHEQILESWMRYYKMNIVTKTRIYARDKSDAMNNRDELNKLEAAIDTFCQALTD